MSKWLSKLCSMVLVIIMVVNMLPVNSFAVEDPENNAESTSTSTTFNMEQMDMEDVCVLEEITEDRTEFTKEFMLSNGLHMAAVYPTAVHYQENGQWQDIDNTLKTVGLGTNGTYTNTAGVWNISFPQQLTQNNNIVITKDGYTLRFGMAGELHQGDDIVADAGNTAYESEPVFTEIGVANEAPTLTEAAGYVAAPVYTITTAQASNAQVQSVDIITLKEEAQFEELVTEKLRSHLLYPNVYGNTSVAYDLDSNQVKESLILKQYSDTLRGYRYTLDVGQLIPVLKDNGQIDFFDDSRETTVMVMPAPFLVDAAGVQTGDVEVRLEENEGSYTLTYLLPEEWLAEDSRAWPVILDPVITANTTTSNIRDQTVFENGSQSYTWGMVECGYSTSMGVERFFMMYASLPVFTSADVIVNASIQLYKPYNSGTTASVEVHKVNSTWASESITWSNKPSYDTTIEDFAIVKDAGYYHWDVTDVVRGWYSGQNTGMMFKVSDEVEAAQTANWKQFYSSDYGVDKPMLTIVFRNNNGLESYWDYTASSAGRAGTGYINNYTGNLVWVRNDIGFGGNLMPVSISHVYNANDAETNDFGLGYGWRTNFNQRVYQWTENSNYYVWEDSDGTKHYFYYSSSGTYKDEDGLELTLTTTGSGTTKYCIADKYGNKSYFDTYGRLTKQQNNQQTASSITITYTTTSGNLISTITDGAGRVYSFTYSSSLLSKISYKGKGSTELSYVNFAYSSSQLTTVTDKDGKASAYTYTTNHLLASAQDIDGYKLTYTYNTTTAGKPSRVSKVCEYSGSTAGGELTMEYAHNQTTFKDVDGNVQIMQFNNWGNTVSIQDGEGRAQYAKYATDTLSSAKGNQLTLSSKLQNTVGNVLKDSSFENGVTWTNINSSVTHSISTSASYQGSKALAMTRSAAGTASGVYSTAFSVAAGATYTFSAYVKTGSGAAYLALNDGSTTVTSEILAANSGWTRLEVSYTNTSSASKSVTARLMTADAGTTYMDCVQIEKAVTASRYNLVENGDFRYSSSAFSSGAYGWSINSAGASAGALATLSSSAAPELNTQVYSFVGSPTAARAISQTVQVSGQAGDTFVIAGWAKGDAVPITTYDSNPRTFGIRVIFNYTDGTTSSTTDTAVDFNPDVDSSESWQYAAAPVVAEKNYSSVIVRLTYNYNANTVYFDGIQLYKEEFGSSYTYDSDGNVISVKDLQAQTTRYEYTNNNLTKQILPTGAALTYTYDSYHNVKSATTDTGVVYNFTCDAYGNNTAVSIVSGSVKLTGTAAYTSDYNRLASTTDAAGKTTTYSYNENTNVLEWVQYPNDTSTTRTNYTYDSMYRLASASANVSGLSSGSALTASYTYTNDNLTSIQTGSTTYTFAYGNFALRSSIKIGSRTLASYSYTGRNNYLASLDYGNGDSVDYTYDKYGRVTKQTYEDRDTVSYQYDNSGALATVTDSATGRTTTYYYDFTDRLLKYVESGSGYSHSVGYAYDNINNLTALVETINGTKFTTSYAYDDDNRVTSVTSGSASKTYTYDAYSRLSEQITKDGSDTVLAEKYSYLAPTGTTTTGQVASYEAITSKRAIKYSYTYDDNGNILSISDAWYNMLVRPTESPEYEEGMVTSYVYDTANQLIRENNEAAGKTWTYTYDNGGNITSKQEYDYTTGALGTPTDTVTYTYGDSAWGDLLTAYNGNTVTSDTIGNMLSDGTWTYTWEHGRQLASMTSGSTIWTYTYDANGMRTERTNGSTTYHYIYNGGRLSRVTVGDNTLDFAYDAFGKPMSLTYNGETYYYVTNIQGDVMMILDSSGAAVVTYTYDVWGNLLATTGSMVSTLGEINPLRYRGYVYDTETGFYYVSSRYYDPEIGRWINADTVDVLDARQDEPLGLNLFTYCDNNPVNYFDPTGEILISTCVLVGIGIGALIGGAVGSIYGYNLARKMGIPPKDRWKFVVGYGLGGAVVGGVIGGFMGYGIGFLCGATSTSGVALNAISKGLSSITQKTWGHILTKKHAWNLVLKNVTQNGVKNIISQALKKGATTLIDKMVKNGITSMIYESVYSYMGQKIVVHYAVIDGIIKISDAWVKTK